ncbi:MAG: hypothetical protein QOD66_96 [Solirubrobacteraceae bacterium]|nr:hypothetical protein [Solirubrobacteraceae bacterium]
MDPVADLGAEHVVDQPVLGNPAEALKRGRRYDGVEVMAVSGNLGLGAGDAGLDPVLELLRGSGHPSSVASAGRYTE